VAGTTEYLESLDPDQLKYAKGEVDRLIDKLEQQKKVRLLIVSDGWLNKACYHESEFGKAKEKLCELIMEEKFTVKEIDCRSHPAIDTIKVYESEVAEYMELNK
jgi:hypothetical protein